MWLNMVLFGSFSLGFIALSRRVGRPFSEYYWDPLTGLVGPMSEAQRRVFFALRQAGYWPLVNYRLDRYKLDFLLATEHETVGIVSANAQFLPWRLQSQMQVKGWRLLWVDWKESGFDQATWISQLRRNFPPYTK